MSALRVGVDIGGTKTEAVAIDGEGAVIETVRVPTGFGAEAVIESTVDVVLALAARVGAEPRDFGAIGVGVPGTVDPASGRVAHAVNLGLDGLALGDELAARLRVRVRIENDVNAAALGVFHLRGHGPDHSMAYLNLGTGLAAGLVLGGRLWRGSRGTAGEIGHIPVDSAGPLCVCGQRGCLEMVASGSAVARQWPTTHPRPVQDLFEAAARGDALAIEVRQRFIDNVASAVRVLVLTVDVDDVVIGGGITSLGVPLLDAIREVLAGWSAQSGFLASLELPSRVGLAPEGQVASVGAALIGQRVNELTPEVQG
ncbi:MAG: ROK family protein [Actinomycetota bacterium]|nr:ROK family protein [Actinomycetota bacterium]